MVDVFGAVVGASRLKMHQNLKRGKHVLSPEVLQCKGKIFDNSAPVVPQQLHCEPALQPNRMTQGIYKANPVHSPPVLLCTDNAFYTEEEETGQR